MLNAVEDKMLAIKKMHTTKSLKTFVNQAIDVIHA